MAGRKKFVDRDQFRTVKGITLPLHLWNKIDREIANKPFSRGRLIEKALISYFNGIIEDNIAKNALVNKVDIQDVLRLHKLRNAINKLSFDNIQWINNGDDIQVDPEKKKSYKYTGLNNIDFVNFITKE